MHRAGVVEGRTWRWLGIMNKAAAALRRMWCDLHFDEFFDLDS